MEQVLKNADINILRNFQLIFSNFFLDIEKFYQALSTCQISDQFNYPNRNYEGGGAESALPWPYQSAKSPACLELSLFQPGGWNPPPPGFSLVIATKINRSTPNFLTLNLYYRDIIGPKIKFITCQGVTWSLFCWKHLVSPHIFHCIFTEFSCSTFSFFWHLYLVLISVFWWKNILLVIFLWKHWNLTKNFDDVNLFRVNPISAGGGWNPPPSRFSLVIATKINRSTPNLLTLNLYYRDIIWPKIKFITCQGVTWSLFCWKHLVSPHIFHCIFTEFSCSTFSFFWHLYLV